MDRPAAIAERILQNVEQVILGKHDELRLTLTALLCQGHVLIEDVPGTGKTMLARSIARSSGCTFRRIQFTPDLLPSDITGVSIYNQRSGDFEFRPGPLFAQVAVADEINRATPKTQSALLEAMEERQVSVDGVTYKMPEPFIVLATQNPIEYEGTFPLPEAQLDRFLLRVRLGYPDQAHEVQMMDRQQHGHPIGSLEQVTNAGEIIALQRAVQDIYVDPLVKQYIVMLVDATRRHEATYLGGSPRGSLALFRAGQALAMLSGRDFVIPDDVKALARPVLGHRVIVSPASRIKGVTAERIVEECLARVPVPGARARTS